MPTALHAQEVEADPEVEPRQHAVNVGAHLHSYGIGVDLQYTRLWRPRYEMLFNLSVASFKDRDEGRIASGFDFAGGRDFIFGKRNYAYFFSLTGGMQYVLVERSEFNRVQVKGGLSAGPTMALLKPYLVNLISFDAAGNPTLRQSTFTPNVSYFDVFGEADFFDGFDQIRTQWGLRLRADLTIDLSGTSYFIRAIHAGLQYDVFGSEVPIMVTGNQRNFFGGFLGFVVGNSW